ncbi:MAG: YihY/virulence factor BrkB family protein, partial [Spirochaetales bacterium]|nr:YihY/virulence factor BrkB family protein [Spirochaetales bacterium]
MHPTAPRIIKSLLQRILFSLEQFSRHEMANHAAAGAYAFLLSAAPAVLVIVYLSSLAVATLELGTTLVIPSVLTPFLEIAGGEDAVRAYLDKPLSGFAGAFGFINLIWAARLFIVSIQRGVRVVYADAAKTNPIRENALTFAVELVVIVAVVALIAMSQVARAAIEAFDWAPAAVFFGVAVRTAVLALPILALWLFVMLTYKNVPPRRPKLETASLTSVLCVLTYAGLGALLDLSLNTARYGLLYGILGNLIVGLIKVYFFFWLYFFYAELTYTLENFDSLLFARFHRVDSAEKPAGRLERALFAEPNRLFRRYAHPYAAGQTIFARGDEDRSALYLYRGRVDIYLARPGDAESASVSSVTEGE